MESVIRQLIDSYSKEIHDIQSTSSTASKGIIRGRKGHLVEDVLVTQAIRNVWASLGGDPKRLVINKKNIPVRSDNGEWMASVDQHVFVDDCLVLIIEDKAYSDMSMMKRIYVDMSDILVGMRQQQRPEPRCMLVQLEHMMPKRNVGKRFAYLKDRFGVQLDVFTLLEDEHRRMSAPIHDRQHHKPISHEKVSRFVVYLRDVFSPLVSLDP